MNEYRVALESPAPGYQIFRYPGDEYVLETLDGDCFESHDIAEIYAYLKTLTSVESPRPKFP